MMKKAAWLVTALLILGAGVFLAIHFWRARTFSERIFPEDTILFAQVPDLRQAGREWKETQLGKAIAESPRREVYRRLGQRLAQTVESVMGADPRPVLRQFTRDAAAAMIPLPNGRRALAVAAYASDPSDLKKYIEQKIDPGWLRRDPALRRESLAYDGTSYYKYSSSRFPLNFRPCYAMVEHHLLWTSNEEGMRRVLDARAGKVKSLRSSRWLGEAKARIEYRRGLLVFLNPHAARDSLEKNLPQRARLIWPEVVKATGLDGMEYAAWSMQVRDSRFEGRGYIGVAGERSGLLKVLMEREPRKLEGVAAVPDTAQFFSSATLPDFSRFNEEGGANWTRLWLLLQALTGMDLRKDLLETLGEEVTVFSGASEIEMGAGHPAPKSAVVVQLRDPARFGRTLDRLASLAAARGIERTQAPYAGASMFQFRFRFGSYGLDPAYSLQQSWFLFASDSAWLKSAMDTRRSGHNLMSSQECRDASAGFPTEVNALSCTRVSAVMQSYAAMLRSEAAAGKPWIHEYGLDEEIGYLAGKLTSAASFARCEKQGIAFSSRSSVPAGFLLLPPLATRLPELLSLADPAQP